MTGIGIRKENLYGDAENILSGNHWNSTGSLRFITGWDLFIISVKIKKKPWNIIIKPWILKKIYRNSIAIWLFFIEKREI
jgi:hypothetical protein